MIYSQQHNFVFLANQKAASSSLYHALSKFNEIEYSVIPRSFIAENLIYNLKHATQDHGRKIIDYYNEHHVASNPIQLDTSTLYEFVFVRHPYTRLVSLFNYLLASLRNSRQIPQKDNASVASEKLKTANMDGFLDKYERVLNGIDNNSINYSQMKYVTNPFTSNLRIFKYENLENDFNTIKQDLGIECEPLLHLNKNHIPSTADQLSPSQKDRIYDLFKEEFDTFGYEK